MRLLEAIGLAKQPNHVVHPDARGASQVPLSSQSRAGGRGRLGPIPMRVIGIIVELPSKSGARPHGYQKTG